VILDDAAVSPVATLMEDSIDHPLGGCDCYVRHTLRKVRWTLYRCELWAASTVRVSFRQACRKWVRSAGTSSEGEEAHAR
jgi:hypothetical protein